MTKDTSIFFYHGCNWTDIPARQQYLMAQMAKFTPVVYFDGGADNPLTVTVHEPRHNITVVRGLTAVCQRLHQRGLGKLASLYTWWHLRNIRRRYGKIIFWCAENWLRPYRWIRHDALVYDCIDPCFSEEPKRVEIFQNRDRLAMADAACVFATADELADFCRRHHRNVLLLNNACEAADYEKQLLDAAPVPDWWPKTGKPIAAYLGSLDWRFDFPAVEKACRDQPELHFVLAGNILPHLQESVAELAKLANVTAPGRISLSDGRYLLSRCAIGLIPFTVGKMNDAINPVKMYAYALLGKPMAGTAVRELLARPDIVSTPRNGADFSSAVTVALAASRLRETAEKLKSFAAANTWEARAAQAWEAIQRL